MDPDVSSGDSWAAASVRARRREQEEKIRRETVRNRFRAIFLLFAGLALAALVVDVRHLTRRVDARLRGREVPRGGDAADIAAGLDGPRYVDPAGRFSFVPPRHWV